MEVGRISLLHPALIDNFNDESDDNGSDDDTE